MLSQKGAFNYHPRSTCHKIATEIMVTLPKTVQNVSDLHSSSHAEGKRANRGYLLKVVQCLRFLAQQGLALRGDGPEETNSNHMQLLHLHRVIKFKMSYSKLWHIKLNKNSPIYSQCKILHCDGR